MGGFEPFAFPHFRRQTSLNPRSSVKRVYFATDCLYQIACNPGSGRRHQSDDIISSRLVRDLLFLSLLPFAYKYLLPLPPPTQPILLSFLFSYTYQFCLLAQTSHSQSSFFSFLACVLTCWSLWIPVILNNRHRLAKFQGKSSNIQSSTSPSSFQICLKCLDLRLNITSSLYSRVSLCCYSVTNAPSPKFHICCHLQRLSSPKTVTPGDFFSRLLTLHHNHSIRVLCLATLQASDP